MARKTQPGEFRIEGMDDLLKRLGKLKAAVQGKLARNALGEGTKILLKAAKQLAPRDTGALRASLGRKQKTFRTSGNSVGWVGPRVGFTKQTPKGLKEPEKYAYAVEYAPGKSYLRRGLDENRERIQAAVKKKLLEGIEKAARS